MSSRWIPAPMPDETLWSFLVRMDLISGHSRPRQLQKAAFGGSWREADCLLPCSLFSLATMLRPIVNISEPDYWLLNHTLYPYFAATISIARAATLRSRMINSGFGPLRPVRAISQCEGARVRIARCCQQCATSDLAEHGFTYIRRRHMLPYVEQCFLHNTELVEVISWTPVWRTESLTFPESRVLQSKDRNDFARTSVDLLGMQPAEGLQLFHTLLTGGGFMTANGSLRRRRLVTCLAQALSSCIRFFGESSPRDVLTTACKAVSRIRIKATAFHPATVAAIMLIPRILLPTEPVKSPYIGSRRVSGLHDTVVHHGVSLVSTGSRISCAARTTGVSATTLSVACRRAGVVFADRTKFVDASVRTSIVRELTADSSITDVAKRFGVSAITIRRVIRAEVGLRERRDGERSRQSLFRRRSDWRELLESRTRSTQRELRDQAPALFSFLYRNDRTWLKETLAGLPMARQITTPPKAIADRTSLIEHLVLARNSLVATDDHPPLRLTRARLLRAAGISSYLKIKVDTVDAFIADLCDTDYSFVSRRVAWACAELLRIQQTPSRWRVIKKAGIRDLTIKRSGVDLEGLIRAYTGEVFGALPHRPAAT
jgi:transposase-like protein